MIRWFERTAEPYLPYISHLQPEIVLLADGSLLAVLQLHGLAHELSIESERRANANILNGIWQAIGDDNVTLGTHYIRRLQSPLIERPTFTNEFSEALDLNYRERVLGDRLFVNEWFVSLIVSPPNPFGGTEFGRQINRRLAWFRNAEAEPSERLLSQIEAALVTIGKSLSAYHVRRLGLRRGRHAWFSEIGELLHLLLTTVWMPVPLTNGPLGHAIYSDRVIFGHYLTKVLKYLIGDVGGCPRWAYEVQTAADQNSAAFSASSSTWPRPMSASSMRCCRCRFRSSRPELQHAVAVDGGLQARPAQKPDGGRRRQGALADRGFAGGAKPADERRVRDGQPSLFARRLRRQPRRSRRQHRPGARSARRGGGDRHSRDARHGGRLLGAIAGNLDWRTRPAVVSSLNFSHLADFPAFPTGSQSGRWGEAAVRFKTTAGTAYDYVPHIDDVGMTAIFGRIGSGKSTLLTFLLAMFDRYIAGRDGIIVFFDKDRGAEIAIAAIGGTYLEVRSGEASGMAPLRGFENTPYARDCLTRWVRGLIETDGHGPLAPADEARIARGVAAVMRLPASMRSLSVCASFWDGKTRSGPVRGSSAGAEGQPSAGRSMATRISCGLTRASSASGSPRSLKCPRSWSRRRNMCATGCDR